MLPKFASCFATPGIGHLRVTLGHFNDSKGPAGCCTRPTPAPMRLTSPPCRSSANST